MEQRGVTAEELARVPIVKTLSKKQRSDLAPLCMRRVYPADRRIHHAGERTRDLLIMHSGSATLRIVAHDVPVPLKTLKAGDVWGHEQLLQPTKRHDYELAAGSDGCEVVAVPLMHLKRLASGDLRTQISIFHEIALLQSSENDAAMKKIELLTVLSGVLSAPRSYRDKLQRALTSILHGVNAHRGLVAHFHPDLGHVIFEESVNCGNLLRSHPLAADTVLSRVYNTGEPLHVTRTSFERHFATMPYSSASMIMTPLRTNGRVYGALLAADKESLDEFSPDDVLLLAATSPVVFAILKSVHDDELEQSQSRLRNEYVTPWV